MDEIRIRVVEGPDRGIEIPVGTGGISIGRADDNDVVLSDPEVALYHARFRPTDEGGVEFEDLFTEGGTWVDGKRMDRGRLDPGGRATLGGTVLEVVGAEDVDLGLAEAGKPAVSGGRRWIRLGATAFGALILAALVFFLLRPVREPGKTVPGGTPFDIRYEKVEADPGNIFRYALRITRERAEAQIDDLAGNRHLRRDASLEPHAADHLIDLLEETGFFDMDAVQQGRSQDVYESIRLEAVVGDRRHAVLVENRVLPEDLKAVCEAVEQFGENELGLIALSLSADEARARAAEALARARTLYDERDVAYGNLHRALRSLREVQWYLDPIDPKPATYQEAVHLESVVKEELDRRIEDQRFLAEKSIQLRDWQRAADALRVIVEMMPDRSDPRNRNAQRKLLDVERRARRR